MSAPRRLGPLATASALALGITAAAVAGSGGLDPTFGVNGRVSLSPFVESYASSIAIQADGKLVLAGTADDEAPPPPPPPAPDGLCVSNPDFLAARHTGSGQGTAEDPRANCSVGRVRRVVKVRRLRGIVIRQYPRSGRRLRRGARVNLVVGR